MKSLLAAVALSSSLVGIGCGDTAAKPDTTSARPVTSSPPPAASSAPAAAAEAPIDCGGLPCKGYDSPALALAAVLEDKPLILAVGETHAQKGGGAVASVTKRFTEVLLPTLKDKASGLVVEIPIPDQKCGAKKIEKATTDQKEIIKTQSDENQNEFVTLGKTAKNLGIAADGLHLTCADLDRIDKAGEDRPIEWLLTITHGMTAATKVYFEENKKKSPDKMILTYGGAIHNDVSPTPGREAWSFAKDLDELSGKRYVELDLVVPEFVSDAKNWQSMPWYEAVKKGAMCGGAGPKRKKTIVFTTSPHAYALVFPCADA
ncbi:MAG: hypothetical protein U0414_22975 [Polyangiaceae bacterium]